MTEEIKLRNKVIDVIITILVLAVKAIKFLIPIILVVGAIAFAVEWGGIFHREFTWMKSIPSWMAIWLSIDFYGRSKDD